ncbi:MAG: diphthine synthase [Candidatus Micrarchaeota archaeon]
MSLALVGIGIWDEKDITLRALEELKECDVVFAEAYTSRMREGTLARLEKLIQKKIILLAREEVEEEKKIIEEALRKRVALIVPGDPMVATTHVSLLLAAKKKKIQTKLIHAPSIFTAAIGESGLQVYKFGRSTTLAFWDEKYKPMSTYDTIAENKKRGLHTLVFLDIRERCMEAREALELLGKIEMEKKKGIARESDKVVVLSRIGSEERKITYRAIRDILHKDLGRPPSILIFPGKLHFMEQEALEAVVL